MLRTRRSHILTVLSLAALTAAAACDDPVQSGLDDVDVVPQAVAQAQGASPLGEPFRVFSQNIYLGADVSAVLSVDFNDIPAVVAGARQFWADVEATDFRQRARAIAADIAMTDPHVVGLQEVAQYVRLGFNPQVPGGFAPTEVLDMAQILMEELAYAEVDYVLMGIQENTTGRLPISGDFIPLPTGPIPAELLQFTLGEATLVRGDLAGAASFVSDNYQAIVPLGALDLKRGWSMVTVPFRGTPHHVVNTHLEAWAPQVQVAQAEELINSVTAGLDGVTIVLGDLNSDATLRKGDPSWTPTYGMFRDAGFADAWQKSTSHRGRGFTCCHDPDLRNDTPTLDQRIDFVLYRSDVPAPEGYAVPGPIHMTILGDEVGEKTDGGLWPADHAALFAGIYGATLLAR
ncbi:MAG: hypothetical protein JSU98_15095 [Gemmatimonadales bacterium]|nr:MAG: hypothetical protein JSU98_15095 [Gemmatimonadales bacterium]